MADIVDRNAEWAEIFKGSATGSQRRRYADDIAQASQRTKQREAEEFEALQLRNPEVGRLVIAREKENREARNQILQRDLNERKFQWQQEKDNLTNEINQKRQELQIMQEKRLFNKAQRETDDLMRMEAQTGAVEDGEAEMRSYGLLPGTEGYAAGLAALLKDNPYIDNGYRKMLLDQAFIEVDPAEAQARLLRGETVTQKQNADGKTVFSFSARPPKEESNTDAYKDRSYATSRADRIEKALRDQDPKSESYQKMVQERDEFRRRADEADAKIRGQGGAPSAPPPAQSNNFTTAEDFKSAFQSAAPGTVLMYNGKPYKKP